jgi:hypothetical protein
MTSRSMLLIGLALAAFAVVHVAAAYRLEASVARQAPDIISLLRD